MAIYYGPTPVPEAIHRADAILARAPEAPIVQSTCLVCLAGLHALSGQFEHARDLLARGRAISEELGFRVWLAGFSLLSSEIEMLAEDPAAAERELPVGLRRARGDGGARAALDGCRRVGSGDLCPGSLRRSGPVHGRKRRTGSDGRHDFTDLVARGPGENSCEARRVYGRRGSCSGAVALAEQTDGLNSQGRALMDLAEVLELAGRASEAQPVLEQALHLFEQKGNAVAARKAGAVLNELEASM
jgi:hypothetical protein